MKCHTILLVLLLISHRTCALIVGSSTTVSRQSTPTFPAVDGDNEMRGFAAFEQGFTLEDNTTTCLFNSFFPVSGTVTFNGGTLSLSRDLLFGSATTFADGGTITGNSYAVALPDTKSVVTLGGAMILDTVELVLHADTTLNGNITFNGVCTVEGSGHAVDCTNGSLVAGTGASVLLKNLLIENVAAGSISCTDSLGTFSLQDVVWAQIADYSFSQGHIDVVGGVRITGTHIFAYQSDQVSSIQSNAQLYFDTGMTFSYDPSAASNNLLTLVDRFATLYLNETTLFATDVGLQLTKGTLVVEGECPVISEGTSAAQGILLGDGISDNNIQLNVLPESGFKIESGFLSSKDV